MGLGCKSLKWGPSAGEVGALQVSAEVGELWEICLLKAIRFLGAFLSEMDCPLKFH